MEYRKLKDIKLLDRNPRTIRDDDFKKLVQSIEANPDYFEARPLILSDRTGELVIIAGNQRYRAAKELKLKEVPTFLIKDLTEEREKEIIIRDNVSNGQWDWDILANEWNTDDLEEWGLDIPSFEVDEVLEAEEDDFDATPPEEPITVLGDLYEIGEHRLLCGDSMDSHQVSKLMNGIKADMVFTDPPYEIDFDYANTLLYSKNCHVFIFNNDRALIRQLQNSPLEFKKFFVFHHSGTAIPQEGGNEIFLDHVLVSHEINGKPKVRYNKGNGTRSVIKGEYRRAEEHKHQKPLTFLVPIIEGYTDVGFIVLDFFAGGGSLFAASHQLKRKCYGMELDPKYCDVIVKRMIKLDDTLTVKRNGIDCTNEFKA